MTSGAAGTAFQSEHERLDDINRRADEIRDLILGHERVAILTHSNPDADAVASTLAMCAICEHLGRAPVFAGVGDARVPDNLKFLDGSHVLDFSDSERLATADLVIYVDCAEASRTGVLFEEHEDFLSNHPATINIDHHVTNTRFGTINCVVPEAAATAEVLELMREHLGVPLKPALATSMLAGIYGDTLGLRTPSTTAATMRVAAELVDAGADIDLVVDWLFRVKPYSAVKLWAEALQRAAWVGSVVWTAIDFDMLSRTRSTPAEAEGLINFLAGTAGARASAIAYQEPNGWRVSLRSVHDNVDVAEIAKGFGGGGHPRAAGLRLPEGEDALEEFLKTMSELVAEASAGSGSNDAAH